MLKFFGRGSSDSPQSDTPSPEPPPYSPYTTTPPVSSGPARPIRLVYCDENGKFHMDPEAVAVLQLVKEPVGVVSVCGRARQGKSFILNQVCPICMHNIHNNFMFFSSCVKSRVCNLMTLRDFYIELMYNWWCLRRGHLILELGFCLVPYD